MIGVAICLLFTDVMRFVATRTTRTSNGDRDDVEDKEKKTPFTPNFVATRVINHPSKDTQLLSANAEKHRHNVNVSPPRRNIGQTHKLANLTRATQMGSARHP